MSDRGCDFAVHHTDNLLILTFRAEHLLVDSSSGLIVFEYEYFGLFLMELLRY